MNALDQLVGRRSKNFPRIVKRMKRDGLLDQAVDSASLPRLHINGQSVLNLASPRYLGRDLHHRSAPAIYQTILSWGLSLGMPRLFATDHLTVQLEECLAQLVGQEAALLFPSTAHLALDVIPLLAGARGMILLDQLAYPISKQGVNAAVLRGARSVVFRHNDMAAMEQAIKSGTSSHKTTSTYPGESDRVIVVDGVYPSGFQPAPLQQIEILARQYGAVIYVDDAHGLGVLGRDFACNPPYGRGGSGTPGWANLPAGRVLHAGSLSKAFGVPLAFAAGPARFIRFLRASSSAIIHSSPPAIPLVAAALAALKAHQICGDELRTRLAQRVKRFRRCLIEAGIDLAGDHLFPIQTLFLPSAQLAWQAARVMRQRGVWTVLQIHPPDNPGGGALRFILTADHSPDAIDQAAGVICEVLEFLK
jgi:8-amino-7-oxononanoate synthase